jgi:hypothetical protein
MLEISFTSLWVTAISRGLFYENFLGKDIYVNEENLNHNSIRW